MIELDGTQGSVSSCRESISTWMANGQKPFTFPERDDLFSASVTEMAGLSTPLQPTGRRHGFLWSREELMRARGLIAL